MWAIEVGVESPDPRGDVVAGVLEAGHDGPQQKAKFAPLSSEEEDIRIAEGCNAIATVNTCASEPYDGRDTGRRQPRRQWY